MCRFLFIVCSPILLIVLWSLFNKIGWIYAVIWVMTVLIWAIFSAKKEDQKANAAIEAKRYEEQTQKIKPVNYDPFFPNRKEEEVTLSDLIGSYSDVVKAAVPTKDNPLKAKITYINQNGDNFTINLEIKSKD